MKKWLLKNRVIILLLLITTIGVFFRFYQLSDRLYFQLDEERDWHMFRRSLVFHRPPLIGSYLPPGLYLGPLWMYVSAFIGIFINLNPFAYGAIASLIGVLAVPLIYLVGSRIFEDRVIGLTASTIYSFSYLVSIYNRVWWPLVFSPLSTLIVYFSLWKIKQGYVRWAWPMFGALTLAVHGEPPNITTLILIFAATTIFKLNWRNRHFIGAIALFLVSHLTIIIFEFKHQFVILKAFVQMLAKLAKPVSVEPSPTSIIPQIIYSFSRVIYPSGKPDTVFQIGWCKEYFLERITALPDFLSLISGVLILGFISLTLMKYPKSSFGHRLTTIHLVILVLSLGFFSFAAGTPIYEWFFYHLFPVYSLIWSLALVKILRVSLLGFCLILTTILLMNFHTQMIAENSHSLAKKSQAVQYALKQMPSDASFSLDSLGRCFAWSGYRTLLIQNGRIPAKSYLDELFGSWLYQQELSTQKPLWQVTFVDHEPLPMGEKFRLEYQTAKSQAFASANFGAVEVFITQLATSE